jgi:hypothetical protein
VSFDDEVCVEDEVGIDAVLWLEEDEEGVDERGILFEPVRGVAVFADVLLILLFGILPAAFIRHSRKEWPCLPQ